MHGESSYAHHRACGRSIRREHNFKTNMAAKKKAKKTTKKAKKASKKRK